MSIHRTPRPGHCIFAAGVDCSSCHRDQGKLNQFVQRGRLDAGAVASFPSRTQKTDPWPCETRRGLRRIEGIGVGSDVWGAMGKSIALPGWDVNRRFVELGRRSTRIRLIFADLLAIKLHDWPSCTIGAFRPFRLLDWISRCRTATVGRYGLS